MTNRELAEALRLCGSEPSIERCQAECPFYKDPNPRVCVPPMTADCADALVNSETHIAALQREIEKLRAQLEMAQKPQWVSVDEQLPENEECVLCHCTDGKMRVLSYDHIMDDWDFAVIAGHGYSYRREVVTHWMPLPSTEGVE